MAVLKPFECKVEVDGVALEEFEDEETREADTRTSLTKYIEAASGANFSLKLVIQPGWTMKADYIAWYVVIDGKTYGGGIVQSKDYDDNRSCTSVMHGVPSGSGDDWRERKFRFTDIAIGDKPADLTPEEVKQKYEGLGNISIEIWRKKLLEKQNALPAVTHALLGVVPEKALKGQAMSLSTDLGPSERSERRTVWRGEKIESCPVAAFQFKYRSREALKQLLVIPRSPSPLPLEERDPEDLTPDEARELIRRQKSRLVDMEAVKIEAKSSYKRNRTSTIGPTRPAKVVRTASGNSYVELDDSSDDAEIVKVESCSSRKSKAPAEIEVINLFD